MSSTDGRLVRGEATRAALLDAAARCLVEVGYAATTTAEIAVRAGVSPGLYARYWSSKSALLTEAAARAQRRGLEAFGARWAEHDDAGRPSGERLMLALGFLLELYDEPDMRCLSELAATAHADTELRNAVRDSLDEVEAFILGGARALAPPDRLGPDFDAQVRVVVDVARGMAMRTAAMRPAAAAVARREVLTVLGDLLGLDQ